MKTRFAKIKLIGGQTTYIWCSIPLDERMWKGLCNYGAYSFICQVDQANSRYIAVRIRAEKDLFKKVLCLCDCFRKEFL